MSDSGSFTMTNLDSNDNQPNTQPQQTQAANNANTITNNDSNTPGNVPRKGSSRSKMGVQNWVPPPKHLGSMLLQAIEYNPLNDKDLFGLKISNRVLKHLSPAEVRDLVEVFMTFDRDGKKYLNSSELYYAMRVLNFNFSRMECEKYILEQSFLSPFRGIDVNDFLEFIIDNQHASKDNYDQLIHCFEYLDIEKNGHVSFQNMRKACDESKLNFTDRELKEMIEEADQNGDSLISANEFIDIMMKTNLYCP